MSQSELRTMLFDRDLELDAETPELTDDQRYLLSHLATVAVLLAAQKDLYRELLARRREEGATEEVRADAHEQAEQAAAVLQSARRRQDLLVAAQGTPLNPSYALGMLDQLFFSFCLLTGGDGDGLIEAALDDEQPERLWKALDLEEWLEQLSLKG